MKDKFNKSIEFKTIDEEKGKVEAVFSVYNKLDTDGDVVIPGAIKSGFKDNQVPMVFAHKWDQPIGKGTIETDDNKATFKGTFFMGTEAGKEAYNLAKEMGDLQEWSFGFRINDYEVAPFKKDGIDEEVDVRYLKDLEVFEVSPVLVGANRETYTLAIKSGEDAVYESSEEKAANDEDIFDNEEDAKKRAEELGCSGTHQHDVDGKEVYMPCSTHTAYENMINDEKDLGGEPEEESSCSCDCKKENSEEPQEKISEEENSSLQGVTFSAEVKEVLAALESLIVRAKAIAILREKDGRTLSVKASSALRAVQDDLNDAWNEIDTIIDENIEIPEAEADAEVETAIEEVATEEVTEEAVSEEVTEEVSEEVSEEVEVEVSEEIVEEEEEAEDEVVELEEIDEEFEALFTEAQNTLTEATLLELDDEEV
jgi:HK97 family phage prohead protease